MAWRLGICAACRYRKPDEYGATMYCVFRKRRRSTAVVRFFLGRWSRRWTWECNNCA